MDFGIYPPEINSGRMYAGPGSGPMLAAAQAWGALADELYTAASAYQSEVSALTGASWSGPSAESMTAAASSYVEWLSTTAAQAEATAAQATSAAAAYEAAFASTVPPAVIAANRSLLAALVATNFLGQNIPAIAATEVQYAEMWAQDAVAMYAYAGSSAAATVLQPLNSPEQSTNPGGSANQAAAVTQAVSTPAGNAQNTVPSVAQAFDAVTNALQSLATGAPADASTSSTLSDLSDLITILFGVPANFVALGAALPLGILAGPVDIPFGIGGYLSGQHTDNIFSGWNGETPWPDANPAPVKEFPAPMTNLPLGSIRPLAAGLGDAQAIGGLSVPSAWTVAASDEVRTVALVLPGTGSPAAAPLEFGTNTPLSNMGLAGMAGRGMPGSASGGADDGVKVTGMRVVTPFEKAEPDDRSEASHANPRVVVTGVAARLREITKLRAEGQMTEDDYAEMKDRLLGR